MGFAEITGQHRVTRLLRQSLTQGHLPHALLFTGIEGIGKELTAITLAKTVNCENAAAGDCCDSCLSCRKASSGNHPDIITLARQGIYIKMEQIRAMQRQLRFRPLEGRCRVIVILEAQNMKVEGANALLKVLEEPPDDNLIILTASGDTALLPTIVSRCLHLAFQPLALEDIASYLNRTQGVEPNRARVVAGLSGGSLSRALALLDDQQLARRRWLLETVAKVHRSPVSELLEMAQAWQGESSDLRADLEWLKTWTRDLLVQNLRGESNEGVLNSDFSKELEAVAPLFRPDHLFEIFEFLCTIQGALGYNINKRLSLEALLLFWRSQAAADRKASHSPLRELESPPFAGAFYG